MGFLKASWCSEFDIVLNYYMNVVLYKYLTNYYSYHYLKKKKCMRFNLCISWWAREVRIRIINSISWRQSVPLNNKPTPICQIKCSSHLWVWNHVHIISNTVNEVVGHPKTTRKIVTSSIGSQEWIVIICLYSIVLNNVLKTRRFEVKNKSLNKI